MREPPFNHLCSRYCVFVGSISLIPLLPTGFVPADDNSQNPRIELAPGNIGANHCSERASTADIKNIKHVNSVYTTVGGGAAGSDHLQVAAVPKHENPPSPFKLTHVVVAPKSK